MVDGNLSAHGGPARIKDIPWFLRIFAKPLGWPTHLLTLVAAAQLLWSFRMPGTPILIFLLSGLATWIIVGAIWLLKPAIGGIVRWRYGIVGQSKIAWRFVLPWLAAPALLVATVLLIRADMPFRWALQYSTPALEQEIQQIRENEAARKRQSFDWRPRLAGVFPIAQVEPVYLVFRGEPSMYMITFDKGEAPWGRTGLYYAVTPLDLSDPAHPESRAPRHVYGPWYWWQYSGW